MNIHDAYDYIDQNRPKTIHISGKTSSGKSTFANVLKKDFDYEIVELDQVVQDSIVKQNELLDEGEVFAEVYKNRERLDWITQFVTATKEKLGQLHSAGDRAILDGAVANPQTLAEIIYGLPETVIIYLHPQDLSAYCRNLTSRFMTASKDNNAGLPSKFWKRITDDEFSRYLLTRELSSAIEQAILAYAKDSQLESVQRLTNMRSRFDNILEVEV